MKTVEEIVKKARILEIKKNWLANHAFAGEYRSAFRGMGMRFKEVREYQPGDEERFIDWNVTARMGHHFTKIFEEERELPVYILADVSSSTLFGTSQSKRELMCQLCADLSKSFIGNKDKTGLLIFSEKGKENFILPQKNQEHMEFMVRKLFATQPSFVKTDFVMALQYFNNNVRHKSLIFVLSDFAFDEYENALGTIKQRHKMVGIRLYDKMDKEMPNIGWTQVKDFETGANLLINTGRSSTRKLYADQFQRMSDYTKSVFKKTGTDLLTFETGKEYINLLQQFFHQSAM